MEQKQHLIEVQVEYPWGKEYIQYDCWEYKEVTLKKKKTKKGDFEWIVVSINSETISDQYMYDKIINDMWNRSIKMSVCKVIEHTSNCYEMFISDDEKKLVYRIGHLNLTSMLQK